MKQAVRIHPVGHVLSYLLALALTLVLVIDGLCGALLLTDVRALRHAADAGLELQFERVTHVIDELAAAYGFDPVPVAALIPADRLREYNVSAVDWWLRLLREGADLTPPAFLEPAIAPLVRDDPGFQAAVEPAMRRIVAEDKVAYAICQAVQDAAIPVRTPVIRAFLPRLTERFPVSRLLSLVRIVGLALLGVTLLLPLLVLLAAHRCPATALAYIGASLMAAALLLLGGLLLVHRVDLVGQIGMVSAILAAQAAELGRSLGRIVLTEAAAALVIGTVLVILRVRRRPPCPD